MDGLLVATGHYRNGVLLAPITGDAVAALLEGGDPPAEVDAFDPQRFGARVGKRS
jgi:glycine oxidase